MNAKKFNIIVTGVVVFILFIIGAGTYMIDPLFHYHEPVEGLKYPINDERYQNDGIIKHFEYNAIITGSSMTENFKTSEKTNISS